jgi:hypothetical protein
MRHPRSTIAPIRDECHRLTPELSSPWSRPAVCRSVVPDGGGSATARALAALVVERGGAGPEHTVIHAAVHGVWRTVLLPRAGQRPARVLGPRLQRRMDGAVRRRATLRDRTARAAHSSARSVRPCRHRRIATFRHGQPSVSQLAVVRHRPSMESVWSRAVPRRYADDLERTATATFVHPIVFFARTVIALTPVLCRAGWSPLHPRIVRRVGIQGRAAVIDRFGAQFVVPGFVAVDLA